jgi:hypothetical protein
MTTSSGCSAAGRSRRRAAMGSRVIGPYAKQNYVSHMVYDHTSIAAFIERKWNLPAMTRRDANANDLFDFLDLNAIAAGQPTFPELPALAKPGGQVCTPGDAGTIPPPAPASIPQQLKLTYTGPSHKHKGVGIELQCNHADLTNLTIELRHGHKLLDKLTVRTVSTIPHPVVLRERGKLPPAGRYTIAVKHGHKTLAKRSIHLH